MTDSIRVLHVDDEVGFADLASEFLERERDHFSVTTEVNPVDALEALRERRFDCVISDHDMPGMTGIELLEAVREADPELPFILFTGKGSEEIASKAVSAGVTEYLQKERSTEQYTLLANRIENVVERDRSRRAAEEQKRRLETLISNLPGIAYRCENEPGWSMERIDGECEGLCGYPRSAIESGTVSWGEDVVHPEDHADVERAVQTAVDRGESFECTYRIETADGETKWVWERGRAVTVPDSETDGDTDTLEGFIMDVTDSKRRERASRKHERQFEAIVDDPNLLVGLLDVDGTTREVNETALTYVDATRESVVGRPFWETPWWTDEHREDIERWIADAAAGEYVEYEAVHPVEDGNRLAVEGTFRPVTGEDGAVLGIVVSAKDITERKRRERELRRHNERFAEFAEFVSHDLQSPISTIRGRLSLALETGETEHVEKALDGVDRVDELRTDLVSALRTGEIVSETETVTLESVMDAVRSAVDPPDATSITVEPEAAIEADTDAVQRLFENLLGNSIEHGREDVSVRVGALDTGFYYEDDGPGIDADIRDRIFKPGFSTKSGGTGVGMGMASVRQVVLAHGWEIRVDDAERLDGARFEVVGPS